MKTLGMFLLVIGVLVSLFFITALIKGRPLQVPAPNNLIASDATLSRILYLASLSPSSHNTQLWKVKVHHLSNKVEVAIDADRVLKVSDKNKHEALISLGAYVQTMVSAFKAYGYSTQVYFDENTQLALLSYYKDPALSNDMDLEQAILKRHTDKRKLAPVSFDLKDLLNNFFDIEFCKKGSDSYKIIYDNSMLAVHQLSSDDNYNKELASWMRFSDKEAKAKLDGLCADTLGMEGITKGIFNTLMTEGIATSSVFTRQSEKLYQDQLEHCAGFIYFKNEIESKSALFETGRSLVKLWLFLTEKEISVQPISAVIEVPACKIELKEKLGTNVSLVIRVGKTDNYGSNKLYRRNVADYVQLED